MRTLKKIAAGLLAAALAVGLLTACSDNKVTGTAKSWSLSNTGKVLGIENGLPPQALLTYEVNGTEKYICLLYTSPSPRDRQKSRMPSSA